MGVGRLAAMTGNLLRLVIADAWFKGCAIFDFKGVSC